MSSIAQEIETTQVNSRWMHELAWHTARPPEQRPRFGPNFNIAAAGAIARICLDEARGDMLRVAGRYHWHHPPLADATCRQAIASAMRRFGRNTAR